MCDKQMPMSIIVLTVYPTLLKLYWTCDLAQNEQLSTLNVFVKYCNEYLYDILDLCYPFI